LISAEANASPGNYNIPELTTEPENLTEEPLDEWWRLAFSVLSRFRHGAIILLLFIKASNFHAFWDAAFDTGILIFHTQVHQNKSISNCTTTDHC